MNELKNIGEAVASVDPRGFLLTIAPDSIRYVATLLFGLAILHTFSIKRLQTWASRYPEGSVAENALHLLAEVEVVFGFWSGVLFLFLTLAVGKTVSVAYLEQLNFTEPCFVFVIMAISATRPVLELATRGILILSRGLPIPGPLAFVFASLALGPLLGSYITEPAAMTVTALLLRDRVFGAGLSERTKYLLLGVLFVNVSIGGVLTPYAAPPVLMVAHRWHWDSAFMLAHFGWKAALATVLNAAWVVWICRKDLMKVELSLSTRDGVTPLWLQMLHVVFLVLVVLSSHHIVLFAGAFLFFLGVVAATGEFQEDLKIRESLLVAFFLAGLVVLGGLQRWWLEPLLQSLSNWPLFLGATALTAITDNAALTYLGSQVPHLSEKMRYFLVAGAVTGGGLTVIANAPNPAGFSILQKQFGETGISPLALFVGALGPTVVALLAFGLL